MGSKLDQIRELSRISRTRIAPQKAAGAVRAVSGVKGLSEADAAILARLLSAHSVDWLAKAASKYARRLETQRLLMQKRRAS